MSTINVSNIQSLSTSTVPLVKNSAGTEKGRYCKAFMNYNMQNNTLHSSFGVSSITDNGTGVCTTNFTTSFSNANSYCATSLGNGDVAGGAHHYGCMHFGGISASAFKIAFFLATNSTTRTDQLRLHQVFFE